MKSDYPASFPLPSRTNRWPSPHLKIKHSYQGQLCLQIIVGFLLLHKISSWKSALILPLAQALLWIIYFENELFWAKKSVNRSWFIIFTIRLLLSCFFCFVRWRHFTSTNNFSLGYRENFQYSLQMIKNMKTDRVERKKSEVNKTLRWDGCSQRQP